MTINADNVHAASKILEAAASAGLQAEVITPPISGYRTLTPDEIDVINAIKEIGSGLAAMITELSERPEIDKRWLGIAATHLQQGLMAATRSVARPTSFA